LPHLVIELPLTMIVANIFRARFNFESAATSVLYEPHMVGYEHGVRHELRPASERYLRLHGTYSAFREGQRGSPRIQTLSRSSSGQAFTNRGALPANGPAS
jgi:hypothetical protein